jgi:hypothetical protein
MKFLASGFHRGFKCEIERNNNDCGGGGGDDESWQDDDMKNFKHICTR